MIGGRRAAVVAAAMAGAVGCKDAARPPGPGLRVGVSLPGAFPEQVMVDAVAPLEQALAGVPGVAGLRARAELDAATIEVTLARGVDPYEAQVAVQTALQAAMPMLPPGVAPPTIERLNPAAERWLIAIAPDAADGTMEAIRRTAGLAIGRRCGEVVPGWRVVVDPAKLAAFDLAITEVAGALAATSVDVPAGRLEAGDHIITVRGGRRGRRAAGDALGELEVRPGLRLRDVAVIRDDDGVRCRAAVDGARQTIIEVERGRGARLPAGADAPLRRLDGPAVHGVFTADEDVATQAISAARVAIGTPRWFATRLDPDRDQFTISVGLGSQETGAQVAAAIDRAVGKMSGVEPGRWRGTGIVAADALVVARDPVADGRRIAAALRAQPGVAAAGCDPCGEHPTRTVRLARDRLAAIGARPDDVARLMAIAIDGESMGGEPPVRLAVPEGTDVATLAIRSAQGLVPLGELVELTSRQVPSAQLRVDRQAAVEVWVRGADGTSAATLRRRLADAIKR